MSDEGDRRLAEAEAEARRAGQMARVALIVAAIAAALAVLGLFLPIRLG
jgi:CHASE3 domain sensor protein